MYLFSKPQIEQLIKNGQPEEKAKDHIPVVKLFTRGSGCIWLLTSIDPENIMYAHGLYDLGNGAPQRGEINLPEILNNNAKEGLIVERDIYFIGKYPISVYETAAKYWGYITEVDILLTPLIDRKPPGYLPQ